MRMGHSPRGDKSFSLIIWSYNSLTDSTSPSATTIGTSIQSTTQIAPPTSTKGKYRTLYCICLVSSASDWHFNNDQRSGDYGCYEYVSSSELIKRKSFLSACTTLVNFDDILAPLSTSDLIPNGYKHLNWTNAHYINVSSMPISSGYANGVRSQPFVLYNPTGGNITISTANSTRFSFDSLYLTSAWRDYLNVTIKTIRNGFITSVSVFSAMTEYPTTVFCFLCTNIDALVLQSDGGIPSTNYVPNGTQFIIDDLCISFGH